MVDFFGVLMELHQAWKVSPYLYAQVTLAIPVAIFFLSLFFVIGNGLLKTFSHFLKK